MPADVIVRQVPETRSALTRLVKWSIDLYRGNDCYVPPLISDEVNTLRAATNPAFDFCEAATFEALRDGATVGRITAIINRTANQRMGENILRFGFVDFIDDDAVVDALFAAAEKWGRERGMTAIVGPLGFTDLDHEGMLISGFDELGTMATIYNYPYYPRQMERLGMVKETDWIEFLLDVPEDIPPKMVRIASIAEQKFGLHVVPAKSRKILKERYGHKLFDLINVAYDKLYGYTPLTTRLIDFYIREYLGILRLDNICVVVDSDDNLVAVGITMPSLSRALQRSRGRLFPFGWYHLLRALQAKVDRVDLMLVAVHPDYQNRGVNALLFRELIPAYQRLGYRYAESNLELEDNENVQRQWQYFEHRLHRRRRAWRRPISQD